MTEALTPEQKRAAADRDSATKAILDHQGSKIVVVAGPGTGKTSLFKAMLGRQKGKETLTLTFINALVEDLALQLHGLSEVRTLHGYGMSVLEGERTIFPGLPALIQHDGEILLGNKIDFSKMLNNMDESNELMKFYDARKKYYGQYGYSDIILELVKFFEKEPEKVPSYAQVVVDEFQDFNKLEVKLIEQLSQKNPILIAGDDDQAIYEFKNSSPEFIRALHGDATLGFTSLPLPFCSRSTEVIVGAINDLLSAAVSSGHLKGRVPKTYKYFYCQEKDAESTENPKIIHKRLEDAQISWYIQSEIEKVVGKVREKFDVLVISPFTNQCERIGNALKRKGFRHVFFKEKQKEHSYLEALRILAEDKNSNLGWRMAAKALLPKDEFQAFLKESEPCDKTCKVLLPKIADDVMRDIRTFRAVMDGDAIDKENAKLLLRQMKYDDKTVNAEFLKDQIGDAESDGYCEPAVKRMPITVTSAQGSKGLAADYVFVTHCDARYLGKGGISNQSICNFLVALTRARKKVWLLSTSDKASPFVGWIDKNRIESR